MKNNTEQTNPASGRLDSLDTTGILRTIHAHDRLVPAAVEREIPRIAKAVDAVVSAVRRGGRLIYVGAGSSGRIAALDAAEIPPTFGVGRETVQAVIAGGTRTLTRAVEGAEDDAGQARRDLAVKKVGPRDVVVGIAASGRTPYTVEALRYARSRRATTIAVTAKARSPLTQVASISIVPATGPEVIAGSTRMKAALAQKMILHMISTAAMTRLGHVYGNHMVGVRPTNKKLWERACSMIVSITGADRKAAEQALTESKADVKLAIVMLRRNLGRDAAAKLLARRGGELRSILS